MTLTKKSGWNEGRLEPLKPKLVQLHDSISEEERRRFVDLGLLRGFVFHKNIPEVFTRIRSREGIR